MHYRLLLSFAFSPDIVEKYIVCSRLINEEEVDENQRRKDELSEENDALKQNISELQAR